MLCVADILRFLACLMRYEPNQAALIHNYNNLKVYVHFVAKTQAEAVAYENLRVLKTLFQSPQNIRVWIQFDPSICERLFSSLGSNVNNKSMQVEKLMICKNLIEKVDDINIISTKVLSYLLPMLDPRREAFTRQVAFDMVLLLWKSPTHKQELQSLGITRDYIDKTQGEQIRGEYQDKFDVFIFLPTVAANGTTSHQLDLLIDKARHTLKQFARLRASTELRQRRHNMIGTFDHYLEPRFRALIPNGTFERNTVFFLAEDVLKG